MGPGPEASPEAESGSPVPAGGAGSGYRVALDTYSGPLDLLLYLIRKEEVDICDIPIARIAEQYQRYVELMAELNVNVAGEFLVMAATLMEIKSRMLLPLEGGLEEEEEDPRAELVRQLLEYKRYRDLARELGSRAAEQALKFGRPAQPMTLAQAEAGEAGAGQDSFLGGVGLWELIDAFAKVLSETSIGPPATRVITRERPIHEYRRDLLAMVIREGGITFSRIFAECRTKGDVIAMFIALLELVRLRRVFLQQSGEFGELYLTPREEAETVPGAAPAGADEGTAPQAEPAAPSHGGSIKRPDLLREVDVLSEIEEEDESLGRARERIDAVLASAEAFLKIHHEQARREEGPAEPDGHAGQPAPAGDSAQATPGAGPDSAPESAEERSAENA